MTEFARVEVRDVGIFVVAPGADVGIPIQLGVRIAAGKRLAARVESGFVWWVGTIPGAFWSVPFRLGLSFFIGSQPRGETQ
jgi:hypothetical protein